MFLVHLDVHKLTLIPFLTDISHNQNEVAYSHKVSDTSLSCISIEGNTQGGGKLVAVGDANGTVSMLEVCDSLAKPAQNEKGKQIRMHMTVMTSSYLYVQF